MDTFDNTLNELLIDTFKNVLKVEETMLKRSSRNALSVSEFHLIEAIGKKNNSPKTISELSAFLNITPSSVTIAVNKLVNKALVFKTKNEADGRSVFVALTTSGIKVDKTHQYFHKQMVISIAKELTDMEKTAMVKGIEKLNGFFKHKALGLEE